MRLHASRDPETDEILALLKEKHEASYNRKRRTFWIVVVVIIAAILCTKFFFSFLTVSGSSMEPTYHDGQLLFGWHRHFSAPLAYGDVVVFSNERTTGDFIKRVEGVPGDVVQIREGVLYRNGQPVTEDLPAMRDAGMFAWPVKLAEEEYFLLGDNRNRSNDSRFIGLVKLRDIHYVISGSNNRK